ncbi:MAG: hypothetical protein WBB69_04390 [Anaerolineales bacterium]
MKGNKQIIFGLGLLVVLLAASGCGPSPEELAATSAAKTAAAVTDTPVPTPTQTPTPTPTPIPYDISVLVTGVEDGPLVGAAVLLDEIEGSAGQQITDDVGHAFWYDLPGETVSLSVSAQGYFPQDITEAINRGINQLTVNLERDPHGILPSEVCGPGEKLLYMEDFQDGEAQGWPEIDSRAQGWEIGPNPDVPGDIIVTNTLESQDVFAFLQGFSFENAVWRARFMYSGDRQTTFVWHYLEEPYETEDGEVNDSRYIAIFGPDGFIAGRITYPLNHIHLAINQDFTTQDEWHDIEISTYDGVYEVWRDGIRMLFYTDPQPLPGGGIFLELDQSDGGEQSIVYFDDFAVCELTAPFTPLSTPEQ